MPPPATRQRGVGEVAAVLTAKARLETHSTTQTAGSLPPPTDCARSPPSLLRISVPSAVHLRLALRRSAGNAGSLPPPTEGTTAPAQRRPPLSTSVLSVVSKSGHPEEAGKSARAPLQTLLNIGAHRRHLRFPFCAICEICEICAICGPSEFGRMPTPDSINHPPSTSPPPAPLDSREVAGRCVRSLKPQSALGSPGAGHNLPA